MTFFEALENPLPSAIKKNYDGRMHYDFKKLKYSSYEISEFSGSEEWKYKSAFEELFVVELELDNIKAFSRRE